MSFTRIILLLIWTFVLGLSQFGTAQENEPMILQLSDPLAKFALSPDGKTLAVLEKKKLTLRNAENGEVTHDFGQFVDGLTRFFEFTPDGKYLVGAGSNQINLVTLSEDGFTVTDDPRWEMKNPPLHHAFANKQTRMATARDSQLFIHDYLSGEQIANVDLSAHRIRKAQGLFLSAKGGQALVTDYHRMVLVDVELGEVIQSMEYERSIFKFEFNGNGTKLLGLTGEMALIDIRSGETIQPDVPIGSMTLFHGDQYLNFHQKTLMILDDSFEEVFRHEFDIEKMRVGALTPVAFSSLAGRIVVKIEGDQLLIFDLPVDP